MAIFRCLPPAFTHILRVTQLRIPKGFRPKAEGCEERATLGTAGNLVSTPTGLRPVLSGARVHNPVGVDVRFHRCPRVARACRVWALKPLYAASQPWAGGRNPFGIENGLPTLGQMEAQKGGTVSGFKFEVSGSVLETRNLKPETRNVSAFLRSHIWAMLRPAYPSFPCSRSRRSSRTRWSGRRSRTSFRKPKTTSFCDSRSGMPRDWR